MINENNLDNGYYLPNINLILSTRAKIYFSHRKYLKDFIKTIHNKISYNSQSLFLSLYLMDIIFLRENLEKFFFEYFPSWAYILPSNDTLLNNYILLSLSCLIISYKFNENNPRICSLNNLIQLVYHISEGKYIFSIKDLTKGEACVIKILKYKLNFYTIYHFFVFFFAHGIIFNKIFEKKIFEKIYILGREIIDYIVDKEEYFEIYNGKNNYIFASQIMIWSIEKILNIKIKANENIFKVIYNINVTETQNKKFKEIIENIYLHTKLKKLNDINAINSTIIYPQNYITNDNKYKTENLKSKTYYNTNNNNQYNFLTNNSQIADINNITYNINNGIENENIFSSYNNINNNIYEIPFRPRSLNQNYNSNYLQKIPFPISKKKIIENKKSKEKIPVDNEKKKVINKEKIEKINYIKDNSRIKSNSLFISDRIIENDNNYQNIINYTEEKNIYTNEKMLEDININIDDELKSEEKINRPRIFNNLIKLKLINNDYKISSPNKVINSKKTLFQNYRRANKKFITERNIKEDKKNKTLNLLQPKDNIRKKGDKTKKSIINKITKNNNTIIINNNININNYYDRPINSNRESKNKNYIIDKSIQELIGFSSFGDNYNTIKNDSSYCIYIK